MKLDQRRWSYVIKAPFEMTHDVREVIGLTVLLDGTRFEVRGVIPKAPPTPFKTGDAVELLVRIIEAK